MTAATPRRRGRVRSTVVAAFVVVAASIGSVLTAVPVIALLPIDPAGLHRIETFVPLFVASYVGMALVAVAYLVVTGRGLGFLDLRAPSGREVGLAIGASLLILGAVAAVWALASVLDLPTASNRIVEPGLANPTLLLALIPLAVFVNAPVEELLFRNVVQKSLYDGFSRRGANAVTSVLFALLHVPAFYRPEPVAIAISLALIFFGSYVFGAVYARTETLFVPSIAHGIVNAAQFAALYVAVRYGAVGAAVP